MELDEEDERPILTAVSSSARQLYLLLRCINFAEKAHVQISDEGLKFSVDEASVMEGMSTTLYYRPPSLIAPPRLRLPLQHALHYLYFPRPSPRP
jgi:hypothetical protein